MKIIDEKALKDFYRQQGATEEAVNAVDLKKVEDLILSCGSMEEAIDTICETYPQLDKEWLKKTVEDAKQEVDAQLEANSNPDSEDVVDLDEDDLEAVAGGSAGSWFKKNWPILVGAAAGMALAAGGMAMYSKFKGGAAAAQGASASNQAAAGQGAEMAAQGEGASNANANAKAAGGGGMGMGSSLGLFAASTILPSLIQEL